ncbi:hypothetical protein ACSSS7_001447 [Eimeria intestinalis]
MAGVAFARQSTNAPTQRDQELSSGRAAERSSHMQEREDQQRFENKLWREQQMQRPPKWWMEEQQQKQMQQEQHQTQQQQMQQQQRQQVQQQQKQHQQQKQQQLWQEQQQKQNHQQQEQQQKQKQQEQQQKQKQKQQKQQQQQQQQKQQQQQQQQKQQQQQRQQDQRMQHQQQQETPAQKQEEQGRRERVRCSYCQVAAPACLVRCGCGRHFCNLRASPEERSHILTHLIRSGHKQASFPKKSLLGDSIVKCCRCAESNVFQLGIKVLSKEATSAVFVLCRAQSLGLFDTRDTCHAADMGSNRKDATTTWEPLIVGKAAFAAALAKARLLKQPLSRACAVAELIHWRPLSEAKLRYDNFEEYVKVQTALVHAEELEQEHRLRSLVTEDVTLVFKRDELRRVRASFVLDVNKTAERGSPVRIYSFKHKVVPGGKVVDAYEWWARATITRCDKSTGLTEAVVVESSTGERMKAAIKQIGNVPSLRDVVLGRNMPTNPLQIGSLPRLCAPNLPLLNPSQQQAVTRALQHRLTLIQVRKEAAEYGRIKSCMRACTDIEIRRQHQCVPSHLHQQLPSNVSEKGQVVNMLAPYVKYVKGFEKNHSVCVALDTMIEIRHGRHLGSKKLSRGRCIMGCNIEFQSRHLHSALTASRISGKSTSSSHCVSGFEKFFTTKMLGRQVVRIYSRLLEEALVELSPALEELALHVLVPKPDINGESSLQLIKTAKNTALENVASFVAPAVVLVTLLGDECQDGPSVQSGKAMRAGLDVSFFVRCLLLKQPAVRLNIQYRMHPEIAKFPSKQFYDDELQSDVSAEKKKIRWMPKTPFVWPSPSMPSFFYHCSSTEEEMGSTGSSLVNRSEAEAVVDLVCHLLKSGAKTEQMTLLTFYLGQAHFLARLLKAKAASDSRAVMGALASIEPITVSSFQGKENDIVILSCVRSNSDGGIGFLNDFRRLNVALTRARCCLFLVGDARMFDRNRVEQQKAQKDKGKEAASTEAVSDPAPPTMREKAAAVLLLQDSAWANLLKHYDERKAIVTGSLSQLRRVELSTLRASKSNNPASTPRGREIASRPSFLSQGVPDYPQQDRQDEGQVKLVA